LTGTRAGRKVKKTGNLGMGVAGEKPKSMLEDRYDNHVLQNKTGTWANA